MKKNYFNHFDSETLPKVKTYFGRVRYIPWANGEAPKVGIPVAQSTEDPIIRVANSTPNGNFTATNTAIIHGGDQ
jgi:hypothetical protein